MKRFCFFVVLILLPFFIAAQNNKRVAILETVDKFDKVEYGVEFQLRAFITDAVNKTPGYEGYDRVDMSQINKEHDFQRTGMVSDDDIKKLGEMTGASSVVVAEAAAYGNNRVIIAAKIINIESGRIENSTRPKVASINDNGMEVACNEVVAELLGVPVSSSGTISSTSPVRKEPPSQYQDYVDLGLPSGTLWKKTNESEKLDYNTALSKYGQQMPTRDHIVELKTYCTLEWTGKGYNVTGKNGKSIYLPATDFGNHVLDGIGGFYWLYSSVAKNSGVAPIIYFGPNSRLRIGSSLIDTSNTMTIRLIKEP